MYYDSPPGLQILHCVRSGTEGGESSFVDLIEVASGLPSDIISILESVWLTFRKQRDNVDLVYQRRVIERTGGRVTCVNWSPMFEGVPYGNQEVDWGEFYEAYDFFEKEVEDKKWSFRVEEGEGVVFNNRRMGHGRRGFKGERWMQGG